MAYLKKKIARLALQVISVFGIIFGLSCFFTTFFVIFSISRGDIAFTYGWLFYLAVLLVLGAFLTYPSYLMLRGRSFEVMKSISILLALFSSILVEQLGEVFVATSVSEKTARLIEDIAGIASLLSIVVFYLIYDKLLKKLLELAYDRKKFQEHNSPIIPGFAQGIKRRVSNENSD